MDTTSDAAGGVQLRTLVVAGLPLVALAPDASGDDGGLRDQLVERGITPLPAFLGHDLPRGARVGFQLDATQVQLVDERETTLLRAPRGGTDPAWCQAALRLKGTMLVHVDALDLGPHVAAAAVAAGLDARARAGGAVGAIVGVAEERRTLPLVFG
jgi:hypothetical protein